MEKILKFSSTSKISGVYSNPPPKLKPQHYYSEHEEESHHYYDYSNYGLYVKIYTKKATCHVEPLKPIYETDHEPIFSSPLIYHSGHHHHQVSSKSSHLRNNNGYPSRRKSERSKHFKGDEAHSGDKRKNIHHKLHKEHNLKNHPFRHLIFSPFIPEQVFLKHINMLYRGLLYAQNCLKGPSENFLAKKQMILPVKPGKENFKTLFLDLDETLVHSCSHREKNTFVVKSVDEENRTVEQAFKIRPYCREFIEEMSQIYEIYIFTASTLYYAKSIIDFLDPGNKYISGILDRTKCLKTKNGFFIKDLRIIKNRELKNMIIVDNLAHSFGFQIDNGIPILEWHDSFKDQELIYLRDYLREVAIVEDVREFNKNRLKLNELGNMRKEELNI